MPEGFSNSVQFLGNGSIPGLLLPGEKVRVPVYWAGWLAPFDAGGGFQFNLNVLDVNDTTPLNHDELETTLRPDYMTDDAWDIVWPNLKSYMGDTWGSYVRMLDDIAGYLTTVGREVRDVKDLYNVAIDRANDAYNPFGTFATSTDILVSGTATTISFTRISTDSSISSRYVESSFGYGWDHNWNWKLEVQTNGDAKFKGPFSATRTFQPDARTPGAFISVAKDGSFLKLTGGKYTLTEGDGTVYTFTTEGLLDTVTDVNGNKITLTYQLGRLDQLSDSNGNRLKLSYNPQGKIISVTSSKGDAVTYVYDPTGKYLLSVTRQDGTNVSYTYVTETSENQGELSRATAETGLTAYGAFFNYVAPPPSKALTSITYSNSDGSASSISYIDYNAQGGVCGVRDDSGYSPVLIVCGGQSWSDSLVYHTYEGDRLVQSTYYNEMGYVSRIEDPQGHVLIMSYDSKDRLVKIDDQTGAYSTISYDKQGNPTKTTNPLGETLQCYYNPKTDLMETLTDANGNITSFVYLNNGEINSITRADGTKESFWYFSNGNLGSTVNRRGDSYTYSYDTNGNMVTKKPSNAPKEIQYGYDSRGNLTKITSPADEVTLMEYDSNNQLTKITYPNGRLLSYTYDAKGRRTSISDGGTYYVKYTYNALGLLEKVLDGNKSDALITQYTYGVDGMLLRETQGNGTYTEYSYDTFGNLLTKKTCDSTEKELSRFDYTYDGQGYISSMTTLEGIWTYGYDAIGQLTSSVFVFSQPDTIANQNLTWQYDAMGNRVSCMENGTTISYVGNNMNQ